jgi:hypothetical protein
MRLNPPKKITFWASVIIAAVGFLAYLLGHFDVISVAWFGLTGVILIVVAFVLLVLGLIIKGL